MKSKIGIVLTLLTLFELTFTSQVVMAANEITRLVPFQGRLHGGDNKIVADGVYDISFNVYDTATGGTALWTETHPKVSVIHGYVNILLGGINPMVESNYATQAPLYDESKNIVNFGQQKYLGISINGGAEMFPRSQLVPSFHAYTANHATHATHADDSKELGGLPAASYATTSYVNASANVINTKINNDINTLSNTVNTNFSSKFVGNKAKDSDLLDGKDYSWFLPKTGKAVDADKLDGLNSTSFLRSTGKAVDADKLDGHDTSYFSVASSTNSKITSLEGKFTGTKAKDSNLLDGFDSSNFMKSTHGNGYYGLVNPDGSTSNWTRTTTSGLLPVASGGASSLGTNSWNFSNIYGVNIYDGNILLEDKYLGKTAKSADADKLDNLDSTSFLRNTGKAVDADKLDGLDNTFFRNANNLNAGTVPVARLPATNHISMSTTTNVSDSYGFLYIGDMLIQYGRRASVAGNKSESIAIKCYLNTSAFVVTASYSNTSMDEPDAATTYKNSNCSIRVNNALGAARAIEWISIGKKQ
jgi:hypothetical protein